jgi:hypothetical protein
LLRLPLPKHSANYTLTSCVFALKVWVVGSAKSWFITLKNNKID